MPESHQHEEREGFEIHTLSNKNLQLRLAPQLGGRVVSLFDRQANREWLDGWLPEENRRLWLPSDPKDFSTGTGSGIDECFPSVLPCHWDGQAIPDHGELWNTAPDFSFGDDFLTCLWNLKCLPFTFERTIRLKGSQITFNYRIKNLGDHPLPFLWALHPLFRLEEDDHLILQDQPTQCQSPEGKVYDWPSPQDGQDLSRADTGIAEPAAAKVFLGPLQKGDAILQGTQSRLHLKWPADLFPWAGIWITRGAWKGLHHWAIEPTNAPFDHLDRIPPELLTPLEPQETQDWALELEIR